MVAGLIQEISRFARDDRLKNGRRRCLLHPWLKILQTNAQVFERGQVAEILFDVEVFYVELFRGGEDWLPVNGAGADFGEKLGGGVLHLRSGNPDLRSFRCSSLMRLL